MSTALTLIGQITITSAQATVSFMNIPQTYQDLVLVSRYAMSSGGGQPTLQLNNDTGNNYTVVGASGYSTSSLTSWSYTSSNIHPMNYTGISANEFGFWRLELMDYAQTTKQKIGISRSGHTGEVGINGTKWASTSAITSMTLTANGNFNTSSVFSLYGVLG